MRNSKFKILSLGIVFVPITFTLVSCSNSNSFDENTEYDGTNTKSKTKLVKIGDLSKWKASNIGYEFPIENYINMIDGKREWLLQPLKYTFVYSNKFPTRVNYNFSLSAYKDLSGSIVNEPINIFISIYGFAE
ncbi:MAG: hypothetical protein KFW07_03095 [Mycoplasmataceae bacterium]|nr:hypothetical protein [Mycoplasmataceae bacterium]